MSRTIQSEYRCLSSNACYRSSAVGQNSFVDQVFDQIHESNRRGRTFFDDFDHFSIFDGKSFGLIKDVGERWATKMFEYFSPNVKNGQNAKSHKKQKRRKSGTKNRVDSTFSSKDFSELSNWHDRWANLNYVNYSGLSFDDLAVQETSLNVIKNDRFDVANGDDDDDETDYDENFSVKYVPIVQKEHLPSFRKKYFENENYAKIRYQNHFGDENRPSHNRQNSRRRFQKRIKNRSTGLAKRRRRKHQLRRKNRIRHPDLETSSSDLKFSSGLGQFEERQSCRKGQIKINSTTLLPVYVFNFFLLGLLLLPVIVSK